jgi:hypothetical protein
MKRILTYEEWKKTVPEGCANSRSNYDQALHEGKIPIAGEEPEGPGGDSDKIIQLKEWFKELGRFIHPSKFLLVENYEGEGGNGYEQRLKVTLFTDRHQYHIKAIDRSKDEGYLGCIARRRKSRAGEDWLRGSDLADGKFVRRTWDKIKNDMLAYELVPLAPPVERTADIEESVEGPSKGEFPGELGNQVI